MRREDQLGSPIAFSQAVEWLKQQNTSALDGHFLLQSQHCELHSRLHEYTTVGIMKSTTLAENAGCLLARAGLPHLNVQGEKNSTPYWQARELQTGESGQEKTAEYLQSFYTQEAALSVFNAYKEDYETFSLPFPGWIEGAHGSLFHSTDFQCAPPKPYTIDRYYGLQKMNGSSLVGKLAEIGHGSDGTTYTVEDIDDIPTLAGLHTALGSTAP